MARVRRGDSAAHAVRHVECSPPYPSGSDASTAFHPTAPDSLGDNGQSIIHSGILLVIGIGIAAILNAIFSLVLTALAGPAVYSTAGPLLSLGTAAAAASVGIEYTAAAAIVRSQSFTALRRPVKRLLTLSVVAFSVAPVIHSVLHISILLSILGVLLLVTSLFAAIPIAMLLASGLIWPLIIIAIVEGIIRTLAFVPFAHITPLIAALSVSIGVTVVGGATMAAYAFWQFNPGDRPSTHHEPTHSSQISKSLLALSLYVPLVLPMWLARHLFLPERAGVLALAALLASGIAMLAGPVTSAAVPRIARGVDTCDIHRGAWLCAGVAFFAAICVFTIGPSLLPMLTRNPLIGLRSALGPLCLAAIGWTIAGYFSWVNIVQGVRPYRFIAISLLGVAAQACLAFTIGGSLAVSAGPLLALAIFSTGFLHRPHLASSNKELSTTWLLEPVPVSIGIMAYNEEHFIGPNLLAFLTQQSRLTDVTEIIVIVSGSTDNTEVVVRRIAEDEPKVRLIIEPERRGKVFAVDHFLREAHNEICVVASADVTPSPDCLDYLIRPMIDDVGVGMTGPTVVPVSRGGLLASMHRALWGIHNRMGANSSNVKLGEIVAVRKSLAELNPVVGCDEVLLEASVVSRGARLSRAHDAIVHNVGPTTISEYLAHRRRIHVQHLVTRRDLGYCPATLPVRNALPALLAEVVDRPTILPAVFACAMAELIGRLLGRYDLHRGENALTWQPSLSARLPSTGDAMNPASQLISGINVRRTPVSERADPSPRFWRTLRGPALISLFIQLAVAPFTSLPGDVAVWWQVSERAMAGVGLYKEIGFSYPPLYGYWCMFLGGAAHLIGVHASALGGIDPHLPMVSAFAGPFIVTTPIFTLLLKLPMIAADFGTGYFIWRIATRLGKDSSNSQRRARVAFYWWAFNPLVIFESAVHGQIDAIAACTIAAAVFYALDSRWLLAGIAVALGVAVKLSPVYLIPPLLGFALVRKERARPNVSMFVLGGIITGAVMILPVLGGGLIQNIFTRAAPGGITVGGLGLTGLTKIPDFRLVGAWFTAHDAAFTDAAVVATILVSITAGFWSRKQCSEIVLAKACLVAMAASLVFSPVVNPQYLLWVIPLLAIGAGGLYGGRSDWYKGALSLLAVGGIGYLISLFGWPELLAPSSAAFGWPSAQTIMAFWALLARDSGPSWLPASLGAKLAFVCTCFVLLGGGLATAGLLGARNAILGTQPIARSQLPRHMRWPRIALVATVMVAIEVAALAAPVAASAPILNATVIRELPDNVRIDVRGDTAGVQLAAFPISKRPLIRHVLVYWSPTYPDSGAMNTTVLGTTQALQNLLDKVPVTAVDAHGLGAALQHSESAPGTLLLDAAGTLPTTIWNTRRSSILKNWINAGGILAFAGNIPGYYSVSKGPIVVPSHGQFQLASTVEVLGINHLLPTGIVAGFDNWLQAPYTRSSRWARALGLEYSQGEVPISVKAVIADGGSPLGLVGDQGNTSEAFVPLGRGGILDFAGIDIPGTIAHDVARLIQTDWFGEVAPPVVSNSGARRAVLDIQLPPSATSIEVVAFSDNSHADWTWTKRLTWNTP